jgi:hypothetical protein
MGKRLSEALRNMTQTFDKEKAVACGTRLKIRVSAAVDRLILAKIRYRGCNDARLVLTLPSGRDSPSTPETCANR